MGRKRESSSPELLDVGQRSLSGYFGSKTGPKTPKIESGVCVKTELPEKSKRNLKSEPVRVKQEPKAIVSVQPKPSKPAVKNEISPKSEPVRPDCKILERFKILFF